VRRVPTVEHVLWTLAVISVSVGAASLRVDARAADSGIRSLLAAPEPLRSDASDSLEVSASAIVERDPFRVQRRPATVRFDPTGERGEAIAPPRPPRPMLSLKGTIGGPPWAAILEGVPGHDAALLVRSGDVVGELKIRFVLRDTVVVQGPDTTWRLTVRRPWQ
jgi:hypothetical protein